MIPSLLGKHLPWITYKPRMQQHWQKKGFQSRMQCCNLPIFLQTRALIFFFPYFTMKTKSRLCACTHTQSFFKHTVKKNPKLLNCFTHWSPKYFEGLSNLIFLHRDTTFWLSTCQWLTSTKKSKFELLSFFQNSFLPTLGVLVWQFTQSPSCF